MLKTVILVENPLEPETMESHEVEDVKRFLFTRFDKFPKGAKIYHNQVADSNDVTPFDTESEDRLEALTGTFYVVVFPGAAAIPYIIYVVIAIAAYYYAKSQIPASSNRNVQTASPNNELSNRTNEIRLNARIPDPFGTNRSTPDLLAVTYKMFDNHVEVEVSYMCIGRGEYEVPANEVQDDTTPASEIEGTSVEVFAPFTSPNSGDAPQLRIGDAITEPLYTAKRLGSVNGQVLKSVDVGAVGVDNIRFFQSGGPSFPGAGICEAINTGGLDYAFDFKQYFQAGDLVELINATYDFSSESNPWLTATSYALKALVSESGVYYTCIIAHTSGVFATDLGAGNWAVFQITVDLDGIYTVAGTLGSFLYDYQLALEDPTSVTTDWDVVSASPTGATGYVSPTIQRGGDPQWVGPFTVKAADLQQVFSNFVALNGLYGDNGTIQYRVDVAVQLEITPVDSDGIATGGVETFNGVVEGSGVLKSIRALTLKADFGTQTTGYAGYFKIRARRVTPKITSAGTILDEVKWRDVYSMGEVSQNDFGNVTTVHSITQATAGALVVKNRKLNMLTTRKIPLRVSGSTFTTELFPTNNAAEILSAVCLDPFIGNRALSEIDFDSFYDTVAEIIAYFGIDLAGEFNYTFDNSNLSFEETVSAIAQAIFCTGFRFGNVIKINFEKETEDSTLLFNHRNKLPGSEKRTVRFGNQDDNDGVELEYVDPEDDALVKYYLPVGGTPRNAKKVETVGIRSKIQAYWHAWRLWNKIRFQNVATEFDATQEADLLVLNDRILVADNTRPNTQDGDVISQNGLELQMSQPTVFESGETYLIFLQHTDNTTESIGVTAGSDQYHAVLANAPKAPLSLDPTAYARATYHIVGNSSEREHAFLVSEKDTLDNFTSRVTGINYDSRYYDKDKDYEDGIIDEDGNTV